MPRRSKRKLTQKQTSPHKRPSASDALPGVETETQVPVPVNDTVINVARRNPQQDEEDDSHDSEHDGRDKQSNKDDAKYGSSDEQQQELQEDSNENDEISNINKKISEIEGKRSQRIEGSIASVQRKP
jgi:hypothetical protein